MKPKKRKSKNRQKTQLCIYSRININLHIHKQGHINHSRPSFKIIWWYYLLCLQPIFYFSFFKDMNLIPDYHSYFLHFIYFFSQDSIQLSNILSVIQFFVIWLITDILITKNKWVSFLLISSDTFSSKITKWFVY